jgi:hypothetical protein
MMETTNTKNKRKELIELFTDHFKVAHILYMKKFKELDPHNPDLEKNKVVNYLLSKYDKSEMRNHVISEYRKELIEVLERKILETYNSLSEQDQKIVSGETCSKELLNRVVKFLNYHRSRLTNIPAIHLREVINTEVFMIHYKNYIANELIETQESQQLLFKDEVAYYKENGKYFSEEEEAGAGRAKKKNSMTSNRGSF